MIGSDMKRAILLPSFVWAVLILVPNGYHESAARKRLPPPDEQPSAQPGPGQPPPGSVPPETPANAPTAAAMQTGQRAMDDRRYDEAAAAFAHVAEGKTGAAPDQVQKAEFMLGSALVGM